MKSALIRKEIKEHVLSKKGIWIFFAVTILFSGLAFSFISVKELSLLAQVEVNMTFMKVMVGLSVLVSLVLGATMYSSEKEQGTLESLMLTPLSRMQITLSKVSGIIVFWLVLSLLSLPYFYALANGTNLFPKILVFLYLIAFPLVIAFTCLSLAFSAWLSSTKNALMLSIVLFIVTAIPMFLSTTMKKAGFAYLFDRLSPISSSLLAMKDYFVNKLSAAIILVDILPIIGFFFIAFASLYYASSKLDFKGGE
ncbi:ABC transporter permease [Neobacillus sp. SM06]|uniref:ABC transporter permease n=1 Tax=Neobacillus sp. SM06 TaxID=3422492 RepID=UPI003D2C21C4